MRITEYFLHKIGKQKKQEMTHLTIKKQNANNSKITKKINAETLKILENNFKTIGKGKNRFGRCPFCSTKGFSINEKLNKCYCFSCGERITFDEFIKKIENRGV